MMWIMRSAGLGVFLFGFVLRSWHPGALWCVWAHADTSAGQGVGGMFCKILATEARVAGRVVCVCVVSVLLSIDNYEFMRLNECFISAIG